MLDIVAVLCSSNYGALSDSDSVWHSQCNVHVFLMQAYFSMFLKSNFNVAVDRWCRPMVLVH